MKLLFVAIDLPQEVKAELKPLCADLTGAKWVTAQQMHLTLRFIGEADEAQQQQVQTGLASIQAAPFQMALEGVGQFPPRGKARVLWVGIKAGAELQGLQAQIEAKIREVGFEKDDHAFSPHITLARFRMPPARENIQRYTERHEAFKTSGFEVSNFILYSSQLASSGSIYTKEAVFPLGLRAIHLPLRIG